MSCGPFLSDQSRKDGADASVESVREMGVVPLTLPAPSTGRVSLVERAKTITVRVYGGMPPSLVFTVLACAIVGIRVGIFQAIAKRVSTPIWSGVESLRALFEMRHLLREMGVTAGSPAFRQALRKAADEAQAQEYLARSPMAAPPAAERKATPASSPVAPPPPLHPDLRSMKTGELRAELATRGVSAAALAAVFERSELQDLLAQSRAQTPAGQGEGMPVGMEAAAAEVLRAMPAFAQVDQKAALETMRRALADPAALAALQQVVASPRTMQAMREISEGGEAAASKYANDAEVMRALEKLQELFGAEAE